MKKIYSFILSIFFLTQLFAQPDHFPNNAIINSSILDIDFKNIAPENAKIKDFPANNWPQNICGNSIWLEGSSDKEWGSILDDANSFDNYEIVGVSGIIVTQPHASDAEFTHPFGNDGILMLVGKKIKILIFFKAHRK